MLHPISAENRLKLIWKIINKNYADPKFNVHGLAQELNISTSHLRDIIYNYFHTSPLDLIERFRLDKSLEFLCRSDKVSITALEVGYAYTKCFRRVFIKHFEFTPNLLKKAAQSDDCCLEKMIKICRRDLWGEDLFKKVLILSCDSGS